MSMAGAADLLIENVRAMEPGQGIVGNALKVRDGRVVRIDARMPATADRIDAAGRLLTPGLVDMHTHGIGSHSYDSGPRELAAACGMLSKYGTTTVLPTVVPRPDGEPLDALAQLAEGIDSVQAAWIPGLHLEGPFVAEAGAACATVPGDVEYLDELIDACGGRVAAVSLAPEAPNILPVIERLLERDIVAFITHTRASVQQTQAAIDAGARHATHFFDVFPVPDETEPGVRPVGAVETILADPRCTVDFVADGVHVHPVAIRAALAAKGYDGIALVTDSCVGAGLPPGEYPTPWGYPVRVAPEEGARIADPDHPLANALAGSALTMNRGIANLMQWLDLPSEQVWAMGTANPARVLGLGDVGTLRPGARADLVIWNEDLTPAATFVAGHRVH